MSEKEIESLRILHGENAEGIDYFDGVEAPVASPASLKELAELAEKSVALEAEIHTMTVALEEKAAELAGINRKRIPEMMETLGMAEFRLTDGALVSIKKDIKCGITEVNQPAAFGWLEENNFDGIIKTAVKAEFGKGEMDDAKKAVDAIQAAGFAATLARNVHPATLKSFVKERLEKGDNIPMDVFGVFEFKEAKIKLPKVKK